MECTRGFAMTRVALDIYGLTRWSGQHVVPGALLGSGARTSRDGLDPDALRDGKIVGQRRGGAFDRRVVAVETSLREAWVAMSVDVQREPFNR